MSSAAALQKALGHEFRNPALLTEALTHSGSSHGQRKIAHYERLEFLGDRVLGLVIAEALLDRFRGAPEGELGPRLANLVGRDALAEVAQAIGLGRHIVLAAGDVAGGARDNPKLLAESCEAIIAALYLDGGLEAARAFVLGAWAPLLERAAAKPLEPKTALQEWAQGHGRKLPAYEILRTKGDAHSPTFEVQVRVEGLEPASAAGSSKRAAEKAAALALLRRLGLAPQETGS